MATVEEATEGSKSLQPGLEPTTDRRIVTIALLLAMAVAALEQTVVSTAMTRIITQLHGVNIYPWVFSAYLLASTITTPLYGKLADFLGRRRVLLFGIGLFTTGSLLCGLATSMPGLIAFRVIQGLGAGALGPIVLTMISDLYSLRERAKVQGYFSAVWGISSIVGPALGGFLSDKLSWRWAFLVTVPFGAVSAWILFRHVHERIEHKQTIAIDWQGALLLACASSCLLWAVLSGRAYGAGWLAFWIAFAALLLVLFVLRERVAKDPVLHLEFFLDPPFAAALAGSFLIGWLFFGIDVYIPLYIQGVLGGSATNAGRALTPLFLSWAISVAIAAKVIVKFGFRGTALVGSLLIGTGVSFLIAGSHWHSHVQLLFITAMILIGIGFGPVFLSYTLSVQNAVAWGQRGAATGAVLFLRMMGGALGVGLLGASLGFDLAFLLSSPAAKGIDIALALQPDTHSALTTNQLRIVQEALGTSISHIFIEMFVLVVISLFFAWRLPAGRPVSQPRHDEPAAAPEDDGELAFAAAAH